ncbi:hypothetical protein [Acinetobacter sp. Marseille-Q1618]|uniref:hypothetical protein n=1 Tax=Acinetobacter sp. Marseille-Q1618 TaxID=2697502 RepID=UPI0015705ED8|nr:hypothetical protein [Acinetobacter sp. Marseille-Q1618]
MVHPFKQGQNSDQSFTRNSMFRFLLNLTQLHEDPETLIQLFYEHGLTIDISKLNAWTRDLSDPQSRQMPSMMFEGFLQILEKLRFQCAEREIFLFDLRDILTDMREETA